jgi:hypothetical protein
MEIFNIEKFEEGEGDACVNKYKIVTPLNAGFSVTLDKEDNANVIANQLGNSFLMGMAYTQALTGMSIKQIIGDNTPDTAATEASIEDLAEEVVTNEEQELQS